MTMITAYHGYSSDGSSIRIGHAKPGARVGALFPVPGETRPLRSPEVAERRAVPASRSRSERGKKGCSMVQLKGCDVWAEVDGTLMAVVSSLLVILVNGWS